MDRHCRRRRQQLRASSNSPGVNVHSVGVLAREGSKEEAILLNLKLICPLFSNETDDANPGSASFRDRRVFCASAG